MDYTVTIKIESRNSVDALLVEGIIERARAFAEMMEDDVLVETDGDGVTITVDPPLPFTHRLPQVVYESKTDGFENRGD